MLDLADIVGQDAAVAQLVLTIGKARRPHAYIFAGPVGVGRRTTAEALAKVLLCERPTQSTNSGRITQLGDEAVIPAACRQCTSCRAMELQTHADYQLVTKELARYSADPDVRARKMQGLGIEVVREFIIDAAGRRSAFGRGRFFVVSQAQLMSQPAQNALLKTLEEPPPDVTLILICQSLTELLPTTRSRCAVVRFGPLPVEFVARKLVEGGVASAEARFWSEYTQGSLGRSQRLAAAGLYKTKCELLQRLAELTESVDADLGDWLNRQAELLADATTVTDKQLARSLATRQGTGLLLGLLASVYKDAMVSSAGWHTPLVHADQADKIGRIADAFTAEVAADVVMQLARYEQLLWRNVNPKTVWDNVVITCATGAPLDV